MNRHLLPWCKRLAWAAFLLVPVFALAQSPYEGIYFGTYEGIADDGEFALIVNHLGHGTLAAYDAVDDRGYIERTIYVQDDGSFQFITQRGVHIQGKATAVDVSGRYFASGTEGSFSGWREAMKGPLQDAAGYYSGPASIIGAGPWQDTVIDSRLHAIIAADGSAFFLLDNVFPARDWFWPRGSNFDLDLDFDLDLGFGFDFDFDFGIDEPFQQGSGFYPPFHTGYGSCGPLRPGRGFGWPFNVGLDYSFRVSLLGFLDLDLDFNFNRLACHAYSRWNQFPAPIFNSGGIVQIEPDGDIQGTLLDGLELWGRLDADSASAEGIMSQQQDTLAWSGHWEIERYDSTSISGAQSLVDEIYLNAEKSDLHELAGVGDFDGDGSADILWRDFDAGTAKVTLMPGEAGSGDIQLGVNVSQEWQLESVGDLDGDGTDDLIWRNSMTGESIAWLIVDAQVVSTASLMAVQDLKRTPLP